MKKLFVTLLALSFLASLAFAQDIEDVKANIKTMNDSFAEMMINNDHVGMLKYYTDDCISLPSYQPMLRGIDAIKKAGEMAEQSGAKTTAFTLETTDLYPAGQYYIEVGTYAITMDITGMEMPWNDHGKYVNIWQMFDDGSLKLKLDIWNTDVNPWMEMSSMDKEEKHEGHMEMETEDDEN